jgi:enoyl-[acyl-carrier protein] reductase I
MLDDFLRLKGKNILVFGIANRKSVAFHIAKELVAAGANLICSVFLKEHEQVVNKHFPDASVYLCDLSQDERIADLAEIVGHDYGTIHGIVHSVAFANFADGIKPFHDTPKDDFLRAFDISCFSLTAIAGHFKDLLERDGAIVTISISTTRMASENYGYMAPIKAALDSSVCFLAKSLGELKGVRVNAVGASLLKTSASAGIPGYIEPLLFAEKATIRKESLRTTEVADVAAFLLSPRSSGITAQTVIVDAGMSTNYFDKEIVSKTVKP